MEDQIKQVFEELKSDRYLTIGASLELEDLFKKHILSDLDQLKATSEIKEWAKDMLPGELATFSVETATNDGDTIEKFRRNMISYLLKEILILATDVAKYRGSKDINISDITKAIHDDEELCELFA